MGVALLEGRRDQDHVKITVRMNKGRLRREPSTPRDGPRRE